MAKAMVSTVRPNARATPSRPMPTSGKPAASTALPQPPNTSQNVPTNSVADLFNRDMRVCPFELTLPCASADGLQNHLQNLC